VGVVSLLVVPYRLLPSLGFPGVSLVFSPIVTGMLMQSYGDFRRSSDRPTTSLATWWGGGTFAFFMALPRYLAYGQ
jgi:hypothetical protein